MCWGRGGVHLSHLYSSILLCRTTIIHTMVYGQQTSYAGITNKLTIRPPRCNNVISSQPLPPLKKNKTNQVKHCQSIFVYYPPKKKKKNPNIKRCQSSPSSIVMKTTVFMGNGWFHELYFFLLNFFFLSSEVMWITTKDDVDMYAIHQIFTLNFTSSLVVLIELP